MPKDIDNGVSNMADALSGKTGMSDIKPEQLAALGGTPDPIDSEDFSDADFGNEVTASPSDKADKGDEADEKDTDTKDDDADDKADDADDSDADDKDGDDSEEETDTKADDKDEESDDADEADTKADDEDDEDDEDEPEEDDEPKGKKGAKEQRVPLDRFREVNKRMRAAEKRLEELTREITASKGKDPDADEKADEAPSYDFDKAEAEYQDLVLDGKKAEATAKRREIRAAERADFQKEVKQTSKDTVTGERDQEVLNAIAVKYEAEYPEMDETHEDFDPEINLEVEALMVGYMNQGLAPTKAFAKALARTTEIRGLKPLQERETTEGETTEKDEKGGKKGKELTDEQKKAQAKKGKQKLAKAKKAPPNTNKSGERGDDGGPQEKKSIDDYSEEEFDALPKSVLARLRGDFV